MNIIYPSMRPSGPKTAKIMLIGEAPGMEEMMQGAPFVGASGKELRRMLTQVGIDPRSCYMTNVFFSRPPDNKIENFTQRQEMKNGITGFPPLFPGRYVIADFAHEIERLYDEIELVRPNILCCLGNSSCWAVLRQTPKITAIRGRVHICTIRGVQYKVLPAYHPAYILRNWKDRVVTLADFSKLKREALYPDVRVPSRQILVDPTLGEALLVLQRANHANEISLDVETRNSQITVCGIGFSPGEAAVIPFMDLRRENGSYWSHGEEVRIIREFRKVLANPSVVKVFQNGMYDMAYFWENWKAPMRNCSEDTMLMQHALWPELKKDLGTLASIHTDEASWKMMRFRNRDDLKKDE
jgi:uracil-DNA glycosylase